MNCDLNWEMWFAGETALSHMSQLNPPKIHEMAIYKGSEIVDQFEMVDERLVEDEQILKIQLWKYNPSYFAENGIVDPVSLACSFKGNYDERIETGIEELMRELNDSRNRFF